MQVYLIITVEEFALPSPCCTSTNWKYCQEMCNSLPEFKKHSEYDIPPIPFRYCYMEFILLSPSMFEVALPFQRNLFPSIPLWFICSRHTPRWYEMPTTKHCRAFFLKKKKNPENETRRHFVTMVLVNIYGRWLPGVKLSNKFLYHFNFKNNEAVAF